MANINLAAAFVTKKVLGLRSLCHGGPSWDHGTTMNGLRTLTSEKQKKKTANQTYLYRSEKTHREKDDNNPPCNYENFQTHEPTVRTF